MDINTMHLHDDWPGGLRAYPPVPSGGSYTTHSNSTCCYGNNHNYGTAASEAQQMNPQSRRSLGSVQRPSSHASLACRVIHVLLVTCFTVNILILVCLQLLPYVTSQAAADVTPDVTRPTAAQTHARRKADTHAILRQLRAAPEVEEELLASDVISVEKERWALSPFTNWTLGVRTRWEVTRDRFLASDVTFPINEPSMCDVSPFLVVMVTSAVANVERRQVIRDTWGSVVNQDASMVLIFLLGEPPLLNITLTKLLKRESEKHKDIVQANIADSYSNLSFKSIAMLKWMNTYCTSAKYLLKSDDDMYINIDNMKKELIHSVHKRFIMGEIIAGAEPMQDKTSKWYTPRAIFPERRYPKYVSGSAYVISGDLVGDLYGAARETEVFWLEDVFVTGVCARVARAVHVYNGKFGYRRRRLSPCLFRLIVTGHRLTVDETRRMWRALQNPHLDCSNTNIRTTVA